MSIKKKLLIALLTASCFTAGAMGFVACDNNPDEKDPGIVDPDENTTVTDGAYEIAVANGVTADKDGWLSDLKVAHGKNDADIKKVDADANGDIVITYTDDSTKTLPMSVKLYKVLCRDSVTDAPVAGVWMKIGYMNDYSFTASDTVRNRLAKSSKDGVAVFMVTPDPTIAYIAKVAEHDELSDGEIPFPSAYTPDFGTSHGLTITNLPFGTSRQVTAKFKDDSNNFYKAEKTSIPYKRTVNGENNGTLNGKFTVEVKAGHYIYLSFLSHVAPSTANMTESQAQEAKNAAILAASGKYKFTVTADGASATLFNYSGNRNSMPLKPDGTPATVAYATGGTANAPYDNGSYPDGLYTGDNSITLNVDKGSATSERLFGLTADKDCTVTFNVLRTGDAEEQAELPKIEAPVPSNLSKYPAKPADTKLVEVPTTGSVKPVLGDDGYYHVNTKTGPVLLIQLNKALARVSTAAIADFPLQKPTEQDEPMGESALTFTVYSNNKPVNVTNFAKMIAAYSAAANSDGVYGVDENLYGFLRAYGSSGGAIGTVTGNAYNWLLPCQYYQPNTGMETEGDGSKENPYIVNEGANSIFVNGSAYLSFSSSETGVYNFAVNGATVTCTSLEFDSLKDASGTLSVCITITGKSCSLLITGNGELTLKVNKVTSTVAAVYDDATKTTIGSQDKPLDLRAGKHNVEITSVNDEGIWVNFTNIFGEGANKEKFVFEVSGSYALIEYGGKTYNSKTPLVLEVTGSLPEKMLITAKNANGQTAYVNFILYIHSYSDVKPSTDGELTLGKNQITFKNTNESYNGVKYSFVAAAGGTYTISVDKSSNALIFDGNDINNAFIDANTDQLSYVFKAEAGETVYFLLASWDDTLSYLINIEEGGIIEDNKIVIGEVNTLTVPTGENGYSGDTVIAESGEYEFSIAEYANNKGITFTVYLSTAKGGPAEQVVLTSANGHKATLTLANIDIGNAKIDIVSNGNLPIEIELTITKK